MYHLMLKRIALIKHIPVKHIIHSMKQMPVKHIMHRIIHKRAKHITHSIRLCTPSRVMCTSYRTLTMTSLRIDFFTLNADRQLSASLCSFFSSLDTIPTTPLVAFHDMLEDTAGLFHKVTLNP